MNIDGEDRDKSGRTRSQIEETKFWIDRQNEEKKMKDDIDNMEKKLYGKQDIHSMHSLSINLTLS